MESTTGKVWLVGAGPGDPELLTLKAVRAIAGADVLLVDDLVNPAILAHASATARIVQVGKRGGCQSTAQEFIERLMVAEAQAGRRVVRLKGGDPFVFGRGGEERASLMAAGHRGRGDQRHQQRAGGAVGDRRAADPPRLEFGRDFRHRARAAGRAWRRRARRTGPCWRRPG